MIKISSKINYIAVGVCSMSALIGALSHSLIFIGFNIFLMWMNWTAAEIKYKEELENAKNPPTTEDEE